MKITKSFQSLAVQHLRRMMQSHLFKRTAMTTLAVNIVLVHAALARGDMSTVYNAAGLRKDLGHAKPGTTITLAPGSYGNGIWVEKLNGTKKSPIVITGSSDKHPPLFEGGNEAIHFAECNYITLRNVRVSGCRGNGINADDGGSYSTPSEGMVFENVTIENVGPTGNRDGLKLSGLNSFVVRNCEFSGWGGSAIDMVGCHNGTIEKCRLRGKEGFSQHTGIQAKGGCENVLIRQNFFKNAGERAINLGGSTGLKFFRPKLMDYEAKDINVAGNHFVGSMAPIAYVTSINCQVRQNTIINPEKWVMRILQEQPIDKFQPCQKGVFECNLIVFDQRVKTAVNIGPNTKPETFSFKRNAWFCSDGNRRLSLPAKETEGIYQIDPDLVNAENHTLQVRSKDPRLRSVGAHSFDKQNIHANSND